MAALKYWVWLSSAPLSASAKAELIRRFGDAEAVYDAPREEMEWSVTESREFLLVDGYNVIFAWDSLKTLAAQDLAHARRVLADRLCNYRGVTDCEIILVFDAYRVPGGTGSVERYGNIYIVYTREMETADSYIEKTTYRAQKERRVRVITSDGAEQAIALGNGAMRLSAREFEREMLAVEAAIRRQLDSGTVGGEEKQAAAAMKKAWKTAQGVQ